MEYLPLLGLISFLLIFFSAVMGTLLRLRQLAVFVLLVVISIYAFTNVSFFGAILLISLTIIIPVLSYCVFYVCSLFLLNRVEKKHGNTGVELKFNPKKSYEFFTQN